MKNESKLVIKLKSIRNKFILFGIKIKEFYKNNKIASSIASLLLVFGIVGVIVYATNDTILKSSSVQITKLEIDKQSNPDNFLNGSALNFTTVDYNLSYKLGEGSNECKSDNTAYSVDTVLIKARIKKSDPAMWNKADETTLSDITEENINGTDYQVLKIYDSNKRMCSDLNQVLSLTVLNSEMSTITPIVEIYSGTDNTPSDENKAGKVGATKEIATSTTYQGDPLELTTKIRSGISKYNDKNSRVGKFGFVLGFETSENIESLKGKYIKNLSDIYLRATASDKELKLQTGEYTDKENESISNIFGVYTTDKKLFNRNEMPDLSASAGSVVSLKENTYNKEENSDISSNNYKVEMLNDKDLEYDHMLSLNEGLTFDNATVKITKVVNGKEEVTEEQCSTTSSTCKLISPTFNQSSQAGTYYIEYQIANENNNATTTIKRKVIIKDSEGNYQLIGPKSLTLKKGELINENGAGNWITKLGYIKNNVKANTVNVTYSKSAPVDGKIDSAQIIAPDDLKTYVGTLYQSYKDEVTDKYVISRKLIIKENLSSEITVPAYGVKNYSVAGWDLSKNIASNNKYYVRKAGGTWDLNAKSCTSSESCSILNSDGSEVSNLSLGQNTLKTKITNSYYEVSLTKVITVDISSYLFKIKDIKFSNSASTFTKLNGTSFYAVGSYFATTEAVSNATTETKICMYASMKQDGSNSNSKCVDASNSSIGTNSSENNLYIVEKGANQKVDSVKPNKYYTAAMGEDVTLETIFNYGYDADSNLKSLDVTIPVDINLNPIAIYDTIDSSNSNRFIECDIVDGDGVSYGTSDSSKLPVYSVKWVGKTGTEYDPDSYQSGTDTITSIKVNITNIDIEPGSVVELSTKYRVKTITSVQDVSTLKFNNAGVTFASGNTTLVKTAATPDTYITPYKVRSELRFGKSVSDEDNSSLVDAEELTFDASKNDTYRAALFTDVISPALNLSSASLGYNTISSVKAFVTLPKGVNYVYNENYNTIIPTISYNANGETTLTYTYTGVEPNTWIEPLYFDFNIDVNADTSNIVIKSTTSEIILSDNGTAKTNSIYNDVSDYVNFKSLSKTLNIKNTLDVSYGQYLYNEDGTHYVSNVDKNENFIHSIKFHNNTDKTFNDLYAYSIVPYVANNATKGYSGTFEIMLPKVSGSLSEVMCTNTDPSNVTKDSVVNSNLIEWTSCDKYKTASGSYSGFTAYRLKYSQLLPNASIETNMKYTIKDNNPADVYKFDSYRTYKEDSAYSQFHQISLEVISKKITGDVFEDFTVNGIMDDSEKKVEGVILKLYDSNTDELLDTTTSNSNGKYTFTGVAEGKYYITASFNTEKYGLTTRPSEDYYDKSKISVFREDITYVEDGITNDSNNDSSDNDSSSSDTNGTDQSNSDSSGSDSSSDDNNENNKDSTDKKKKVSTIRTDDLLITSETRIYRYVNLGLTLRKSFKPKISKYITKAEITDALGVKTTKDYGKTKLAKLDVRNMSKVKIKVTYLLEIQNVMYYPGYVKSVIESIPDGMTFNDKYDENKNWKVQEDGSLLNTSLSDKLIKENDKEYLTISFDISSKEAGSFVNNAYISDLQILGGRIDETESK